jgi:glycosyltransferase involved in cell wall biosynthesis
VRIAVIAPPWYPVPPSGYGGIEWVVALLADGLTDRGHEVTLFAPPGSRTEARLVPPLGEVPPEELIGDPWYEAAHAVSAYERGHEFDILHDHTGPVGASIGAMSDCPTVHTLHGPFTDQTRMLYRRIAHGHWFVAISESQRSMAPQNLRWAGVVYNGIPLDRYPFREDKDDFLFFLGRADEEKAPHLAIEAARRAGRRLVMCVTTKNEREQAYWADKVEPLLSDDVEVRGECDQEQKADLLGRAGDDRGHGLRDAGGGLAQRVGARGGGRRRDRLHRLLGRGDGRRHPPGGRPGPTRHAGTGEGAVLSRGDGGRPRARVPAGARRWRCAESLTPEEPRELW